MAYSERLAERVRAVLSATEGVTERRMFGGLAFMLNGHMCCGVSGDDLMVRVGPDAYEDALAEPHAREMDFTGRPLRGMVFVAAGGTRSEPELFSWVGRGLHFVAGLPPK